jgi:hypothetical protein
MVLSLVTAVWKQFLCVTYDFCVTDRKPPDSWPSQGVIVFDRIFLAYSKDEASVLKNVSFVTRPREKVIIHLYYYFQLCTSGDLFPGGPQLIIQFSL